MAYQTTNPATGKVERTLDFISDEELESAVSSAHSCHLDDWRRRSIADRSAIVSKAAAQMRAERDRLARLAPREMGKLLAQAEGELALAADILDYYAERAEAYLAPKAIMWRSPASVV